MRLVSVGRLEANKGVFDAIEVTRLLRSEGVDAHLYWVGQGTLKSRVERFLSENNISCVHLLGALPTDKKNQALKDSHVLVVTSYMEGFNMVIGEALLREVPVVAYELPVYRGIYRDYVVYVKPGNILGMVKEIKGVISNYRAAKRLAKKGKKHVSTEYNIDRVVERLEGFLTKVAQSTKT